MSNWKAHLEQLLTGLLHTHADASLAEIHRILRGVLSVEDIRFHARDGRELPRNLTLQHALEQSCQVLVLVDCARPATIAFHSPSATGNPAESRFREGPSAEPAGEIATDNRYDLFLRQFIRLEQRHEFMWAGYVVRELLPRLGFAAEGAKAVLDRLRAEELITISKVPNPKNPDFPATGVQLNHDHPRVRALLAEQVPANQVQNNAGQAEHVPTANPRAGNPSPGAGLSKPDQPPRPEDS